MWFSKSALASIGKRPAGSGSCSTGQLALLCGRREWRELRHNWKSLIRMCSHGDKVKNNKFQFYCCLMENTPLRCFFFNILFMVSRINTDCKKMACFGTKFRNDMWHYGLSPTRLGRAVHSSHCLLAAKIIAIEFFAGNLRVMVLSLHGIQIWSSLCLQMA